MTGQIHKRQRKIIQQLVRDSGLKPAFEQDMIQYSKNTYFPANPILVFVLHGISWFLGCMSM
jgi:hypothetical protein